MPLCGVVGWDDVHALFECDGLKSPRIKLSVEQCLSEVSGYQSTNKDSTRGILKEIVNSGGNESRIGELLLQLKIEWDKNV